MTKFYNFPPDWVCVWANKYIHPLHCTVLYSTVLLCTVLYCVIMYKITFQHTPLSMQYSVQFCSFIVSQLSMKTRVSEYLYTVLYCTVLYCTVLYCTVLYCTVLYCTVLYCTVLYCTVLYCTVSNCTVLYRIVQSVTICRNSMNKTQCYTRSALNL